MEQQNCFNRASQLDRLIRTPEWDMIVIGGGATGLGIAVDAASRGYKVLLLEQSDFAKGTSSRSTKLVHGGVRYLAQGQIKLVYGALHERGILLRNAAHLVKKQAFIIPCYSWWEQLKYLTGLTLYDILSGRFSFGKAAYVKRKEMINLLPGLNAQRLRGGVRYYDGQFDDARLAINLAMTAAEEGGTLLNYFKVVRLIGKERVKGVVAKDMESGKEYTLRSRVVVNATGVFVDDILKMEDEHARPMVRPSQGVHLMLKRSFLDGGSALMIPKTSDGRVLFAVPWHGHVLVGTTDTLMEKHLLEPRALEAEIGFILGTMKEYLSVPPERGDVLSVFAGLRPLAAPKEDGHATKEISRDHKLLVSPSGLVTITGGKWTTYRKMAEETLDTVIEAGVLEPASCRTKELRIHGCCDHPMEEHLAVYGTDGGKIRELMEEEPLLVRRLVEWLPYTEAEAVWAVRYEMARTIEDVLARRLRVLFLDAQAALAAAPRVAALIAEELGYGEDWKRNQLIAFNKLANGYLPGRL
ncbi:FAD-dependent oxidoreductase [Flavitalea sp. BT771]|uniref:glycerol-3-phosphate dehydrogenase/oxidase n=1 Tax=Flavitalea sp. BT771 TaxID=3063329 RepID=UPI0026E306C4|nr:FAD-dependent oxidoreductase [Flavitalea sp. BT771]MDO6432065.1 FAD-dependent oxidoreductase [Flavitalea sp. BT771]MDV6220974.1 FAD-dependent oxidoreductase [Flavitalea sp. BT771]